MLGISKSFGEVWHDGRLFKLRSYGGEILLLKLLKDYLSNRNQTWERNNILSGVPQDSVSRYLLFLFYINDLRNDTQLLRKIFEDKIEI